jgi:hypothetical protein
MWRLSLVGQSFAVPQVLPSLTNGLSVADGRCNPDMPCRVGVGRADASQVPARAQRATRRLIHGLSFRRWSRRMTLPLLLSGTWLGPGAVAGATIDMAPDRSHHGKIHGGVCPRDPGVWAGRLWEIRGHRPRRLSGPGAA